MRKRSTMPHGERYNTIEPDGKITGEKTSEWKGPYYHGRACLETIERLKGARYRPRALAPSCPTDSLLSPQNQLTVLDADILD